MATRTPEERMQAFADALELELEIDVEEPTAVTPPGQLAALAQETTPAPVAIGSEALEMSDRWRHSVRVMLGLPEDLIDALAKYAIEHMPRGRR